MNALINAISLLFFLSEFTLFLLKRSKSAEVKIRQGRSSMAILWSVVALSITAGIFTAYKFPRADQLPSLEYIGIAIVIFGFIIRYTAIIQLKKAFTVDVAIAKNHQLKMDGLYKKLRHPSYLGLLLEFLGFSMLFNSWVSIFVINIPILIIMAYRMHVEEKFLLEAFGDDYRNYMRKTKRILPGIY